MRPRQILIETASNSVTSITGTANQVIASAAVGDITLSLPQSIAVASTPTFASITLSQTTAYAASITLGAAQKFTYDAANFTGLMNGTTAQVLSVYNTYTAGTPDYERGEIGFIASNVFGIRANKSGTGTNRTTTIYCGGTTSAGVSVGLFTTTIGGYNTSTAGVTRCSIAGALNSTATSGNHIDLLINGTPAPTSTSTMNYYSAQIAPVINYSNGTPGAGYVYGLYIAPVNTALPTGISAAIALSSTASALGGVKWNNQTDEQTNYEYVQAGFASNIWTIGSVKGGSGTLRGIQIGVTSNAVGFMGATPAVRQASAADLTNNVTSGGSSDVIADFSSLTVYATDAAAIRNDIYQLARKLKQVNDALRLYGLLT